MNNLVITGIVVYSLLFATLSAYVAWKKNRNRVGFFFLGLVTGVIGMLIILAIPAAYCEPEDGPICVSDSGLVSKKTDRDS